MRRVLSILSVCVLVSIVDAVSAGNIGSTSGGPSTEGCAAMATVRYYVRYYDGQPRRQHVMGPYTLETAERVCRDLVRQGYRSAEVFYERD